MHCFEKYLVIPHGKCCGSIWNYGVRLCCLFPRFDPYGNPSTLLTLTGRRRAHCIVVRPSSQPIADDQAPPAVPGGQGYFPVGDSKYAALTEGERFSAFLVHCAIFYKCVVCGTSIHTLVCEVVNTVGQARNMCSVNNNLHPIDSMSWDPCRAISQLTLVF